MKGIEIEMGTRNQDKSEDKTLLGSQRKTTT